MELHHALTRMENNNVANQRKVQDGNISEYFEYLYTEKLCFKRPQEEVDDITTAVKEMVNTILDDVVVEDKRFKKNLRVLCVGSMSEGTSNGEPDEFYFIVILKSLSTSDDIRFSRGCTQGYAHIKVKENASTEFKTEWAAQLTDQFSSNTFMEAFACSINMERVSLANFGRTCNCIEKTTGTLDFSGYPVETHGPASLCKFVWNSKNSKFPKEILIYVDIVPALQVVDIESVIDREDVDSKVYQHLTDKGGCLLVQSRNAYGVISSCCFKLAFTNAESVLMKSLTKTHRKCYRILKYLFHGLPLSCKEYVYVGTVFHSYALKTCVINHARENACDESEIDCLAKCVLSILDTIEKSITSDSTHLGRYRIYVDSLAVPSLNILDKYNTMLDRDVDFHLKNNLDAIKYMRASLDEIANADLSYDILKRYKYFKTFKNHFVNFFLVS